MKLYRKEICPVIVPTDGKPDARIPPHWYNEDDKGDLIKCYEANYPGKSVMFAERYVEVKDYFVPLTSGDIAYHLSCPHCGRTWWSPDPNPQMCPYCERERK